jgi:hypothetical protein
MKTTGISRRRFALLTGAAGATQLALAQGQGLTAEAVIQRIQDALGGDWSGAPDGFKAGDHSTVVRGIATTAMATLDVLKQAAAANINLVLTCEPTFYGRGDAQPPAGGADAAAGRGRGGFGGIDQTDPILVAKKEFVEKNNLVVFRLHDHWLARKENDMVAGLADSLGWSKYRVKGDDALFEIPAAIRMKLNLRGGLRAVGDKKATVKRVLLFTGSMTPATMWKRYAETDMFVGGEVREWENTHYAADMFTAGEKRALVTVGRVVSQEPGMRLCAAWLKTVVKEVPAKWIGAGDPYWRPV